MDEKSRVGEGLVTLHADLGPDWRGGQGQALLLMQGLQARGHPTELVAMAGSPLAERARQAGIAVHTVAAAHGRLGAALALRKRGARGGIRVVHCHDAHSVTAAWMGGVHRRCALVAARRLAHPLSASRLGLARYRAADRVVAVSQFVRGTVLASGLEPEKVEVVYDGVPLPPLPSQSEREAARHLWTSSMDAPLLGCVGYLLPEKGQEALVRAMPLVLRDRPDCRLILAGDGPCRPRLEGLAGELGVAKSICFAGHVKDVATVYRALDVFLFPSLAEPLGSSLLAAMSYALPVVGVAGGAVPEIIGDERNGLLAGASDPEEIAAAALLLLHDAGLASALGAAARHTIQERFSADRMVEDTLNVYRRL